MHSSPSTPSPGYHDSRLRGQAFQACSKTFAEAECGGACLICPTHMRPRSRDNMSQSRNRGCNHWIQTRPVGRGWHFINCALAPAPHNLDMLAIEQASPAWKLSRSVDPGSFSLVWMIASAVLCGVVRQHCPMHVPGADCAMLINGLPCLACGIHD